MEEEQYFMLMHTVANKKIIVGAFKVDEPPDEIKNDILNEWIYDKAILSAFQNEDEKALSLKLVMAESKETAIDQISFTDSDAEKHKKFKEDLEANV